MQKLSIKSLGLVICPRYNQSTIKHDHLSRIKSVLNLLYLLFCDLTQILLQSLSYICIQCIFPGTNLLAPLLSSNDIKLGLSVYHKNSSYYTHVLMYSYSTSYQSYILPVTDNRRSDCIKTIYKSIG